jgi:asparagine synthase (glutamine-hydrolysing)
MAHVGGERRPMILRNPVGIWTSGASAAEELAQRLGVDRKSILGAEGNGSSVAVAVPSERQLLGVATESDGSFSVLDGEVFGDRAPLSGEQGARSLLAGWRARGTAAFAEIEMDAAFTLWDAGTATLVVGHDRMGFSPLYWHEGGGTLRWSGGLPELLGTGVPRVLEPDALDAFLASARAPAPLSFVRDVEKVSAAVAIEVRVGAGPRRTRYWRASGEPSLSLPIDDAAARASEHLEAAVRRRIEPGATGSFLSAGIDSTLVVATAASLVGEKLPTFTFRYGDHSGGSNEGRAARETAELLGIPHEEVAGSAADLVERFRDMVAGFGEPLIYGMHSFRLDALTGRGLSGLLTGSAGDDLYDIGRRAAVIQRLRGLPSPVRTGLLTGLDSVRRISNRAADRVGRPLVSALEGAPHPIVPTVARRALYLDPAAADRGRDRLHHLVATIAEDYPDESAPARELFVEQRLTHDMVAFWNARWSRLHDIAIRDPYADRGFFDFVMRLEHRESDSKGLSRRMAARLLPHEVAYRPRQAHTLPATEWLRGPLLGLAREVLAPDNIKACGVFRPEAVTAMLDTHVRGEVNFDWSLLALLTFTQWQLEFGVCP